MRGPAVEFGPDADPEWGGARADQPPSFPAGEMAFPPGRVPQSGSACAGVGAGLAGNDNLLLGGTSVG